jgi:hypothetical protein
MVAKTVLKAVGYWRPNRDWDDLWAASELPDPRWLVHWGWRLRERRKILAYLGSGHRHAAYKGYSYCRFWLCWAGRPAMGDSDLTDGEWVWPEGLAHYVRWHWVRLPDEFVATMRANGWRVPGGTKPRPRGGGASYDESFWVAWARREQRRPWYVVW